MTFRSQAHSVCPSGVVGTAGGFAAGENGRPAPFRVALWILLPVVAATSLGLSGDEGRHRLARGHRGSLDLSAETSVALRVLGPNDGEPLGRWIEFRLQTAYPGAGVIFVLAGETFLDAVAVEPRFPPGFPLGGIRELLYRVDSSRLESGVNRLHFYFYTISLDGLIGHATWFVEVDRPVVAIHGGHPVAEAVVESSPGVVEAREGLGASRTSEGSTEIHLTGRVGDTHFVVEAGRSFGDVRSPCHLGKCGDIPHQGRLSDAHVLPGGRPWAGLVLDLDTLYRIHGSDVVVLFWTLHPRRGWAHSRLTFRAPPPSPGKNLGASK